MVVSLIRAKTVDAEADDCPHGSNVQTNWLDENVDTRHDKCSGAVLEGGDAVVHGNLRARHIGEDYIVGEDAIDENGLVGGDSGGGLLSELVGGGKCDSGCDPGLEKTPVDD